MLGDSFIHSSHKNQSSNFSELNFFHTLFQVSERMSIFLSMPETFIFGFGFDKATLICSDRKTKELIFEHSLSASGIKEGFKYFKEVAVGMSPIAVFKTQSNLHDKCKVLYTVNDCVNMWDNCVKQGKAFVIQRFVYSGKLPKMFKSFYSLELEYIHKVVMLKKNKSIIHGLSHLLPGLQKNISLNGVEDRQWIIRDKDFAEAQDVPTEFDIKSQVPHLVKIIEKFYSSNKNCRLDKLETVWILDKKENFFLVNVKSFRVLNIVFKPIQMKKRPSKNTSFHIQGDSGYRVVKRTKKSLERIIRFRTANVRSRSEKNIGTGK